MTRPILSWRDAPLSRRGALSKTARASAFALVAGKATAIPLGLSLAAEPSAAQGPLAAPVVSALNLLLQLEYVEAEFYTRGFATAGLIPTGDRAIYEVIREHETAHVQLLRGLLGSQAAGSPSIAIFDARYNAAFGSYRVFTAAAQALEDIGVRAYKGQIRPLMRYPDVLTTILTIHSVEARHASEIRRLRGNFSNRSPNKGWITGNTTDIPGAGAVYAGEQKTNEAGINVPSITSAGLDAITEAFDEPLRITELAGLLG